MLLSRDEDDKETEEQQTTRRERKKTSTPSAYSSHDANDDDKDDEEEDNLFLLCASISGACGGFIFARAVYKWVYFYVSWEQLLDTIISVDDQRFGQILFLGFLKKDVTINSILTNNRDSGEKKEAFR